MKPYTLFFSLNILIMPSLANAAASCSRSNLTRCLDSACAINVSANPAARCQYCGTSSAGEPPSTKSMRSVSVGQSSKNTLSDKELKSAPTDPGERYAWATTQCIAKLGACTPDDVSEAYDSLIEQSCKAAGISAQMATLHENSKKTKTQATCSTDIGSCLVAANKCGPNYGACTEDADFDKYFAECGIDVGGCDQYLATIRETLSNARTDMLANAAQAPKKIAENYQQARTKKLNAAQSSCKDNASRDACIAAVCQQKMKNKCATGFASEKSMATLLCKFHDIACATVK